MVHVKRGIDFTIQLHNVSILHQIGIFLKLNTITHLKFTVRGRTIIIIGTSGDPEVYISSSMIEHQGSCLEIDGADISEEVAKEQENSKGYILPLWSIRGVPPQRYSPDHKSSRPPYPIDDNDMGRLYATTRTFRVALYNEYSPKTV